MQLLSQHSAQHGQFLTTNNFSADQRGLLKFAANSPLQAQSIDSSQQLNELIEQCQQASLRNGRLIRSNQTSINSMLDITRGADAPKLYDKIGSATSILTKPTTQWPAALDSTVYRAHNSAPLSVSCTSCNAKPVAAKNRHFLTL